MTVKPVVALPNSVLQIPCKPVGTIDETARQLAEDLVDTMRVSPGCVGLAAPQIGVSSRAFCVDVTGHRKAKTTHGLVVLFDPEIVEAADFAIGREGCMSVPDLTGDVARATKLTIKGLNEHGKTVTLSTDAFEARAFLHELDHIDGLLFIDRVESAQGIFPRKVYK